MDSKQAENPTKCQSQNWTDRKKTGKIGVSFWFCDKKDTKHNPRFPVTSRVRGCFSFWCSILSNLLAVRCYNVSFSSLTRQRKKKQDLAVGEEPNHQTTNWPVMGPLMSSASVACSTASKHRRHPTLHSRSSLRCLSGHAPLHSQFISRQISSPSKLYYSKLLPPTNFVSYHRQNIQR